MAISNWEVLVSSEPLEMPNEFCDGESGAVVDFWGMVRGTEDGFQVDGIEYEVHRPMAEHQLNLLAEKARTDFSLTEFVLRHRVGFVPTGEASLFVRVASPHRAEAFAASVWLIAQLKQTVPIWKRPIFKYVIPTKKSKGAAIE